jgi:membrane dipeptidase
VIARKNHGPIANIDFRTHEIAFAQAQGQLAYYQELERQDIIRLIRTRADLDAWRASWAADPVSAPFGFVLLMGGADPIVSPEQARLWWDDGPRMVGLAHYGPSANAFGTGSADPLT